MGLEKELAETLGCVVNAQNNPFPVMRRSPLTNPERHKMIQCVPNGILGVEVQRIGFETQRNTLLHPQRLERSIAWIGVEARLKLRKQLTRDCGDVRDAGHGEEQSFGAGIVCDLERFGQVLDRDDAAAEAHVSKDDELGQDGFPHDGRAKCHECRQRCGWGRPCVVQLNSVEVEVSVARLGRGAHR